MLYNDFSGVSVFLEDIGKELVESRNDVRARKLHSPAEFKTEADLRAHYQITKELQKLFPSIPIISEEDSNHQDNRPASYWLIDPIDGTGSWYNGFDGFVTQVAYIENDIPLYGAIHAPVLKKTWTAIKNHGAYLNGKRLPKLEKSSRLILIDNTEKPYGITKKIVKLLSVTGYIECGSLGLKAVLVADGTADLFVKDVSVRDWDLAPASVILNEVGGFFVQANNMPYLFRGAYLKDKGIIVARDNRILKDVLDVFS